MPSDTIYMEILNPMESSKRGFLSLKPRSKEMQLLQTDSE